LTGTANVAGKHHETTIVLKGTNFCPDGNDVCKGKKMHFDIAAPGFDFAGTSISNTC
jgi:hypothetical protein